MSKPEPKKRKPAQEPSKIKGDPKAPENGKRGKRPTPERPPAARVPPKRKER